MIYTDSNGDKHEIETVHYPEQCEAYHKALEEGDAIAAHFLYIPPVRRSVKSIKTVIDLIELKARYKANQERIMNTPPSILKMEIENRFKTYKPKY